MELANAGVPVGNFYNRDTSVSLELREEVFVSVKLSIAGLIFLVAGGILLAPVLPAAVPQFESRQDPDAKRNAGPYGARGEQAKAAGYSRGDG